MADDNKQVVIFPDEQEVLIDRGQITHKQSKRSSVLVMQLQKAQRDLDDEKMASLLEELDQITRSVIVNIPSNWLPQGVTLAQDDWMDYLPQDKYERLMELARPQEPGEKKG
jgi:hypothetical protein